MIVANKEKTIKISIILIPTMEQNNERH